MNVVQIRDPRKPSYRHQTNLRYPRKIATPKKRIFEAMDSIFSWKNITLLELRNVEITKSFFLKTTSGEWFHFSRGTCIGHLCRHLGCPKKWFWRTPGGPDNGVDFFWGIYIYILSMFKQNKMTYQCPSRKSGTTRKSRNVLPEMRNLCSWILGT